MWLIIVFDIFQVHVHYGMLIVNPCRSPDNALGICIFTYHFFFNFNLREIPYIGMYESLVQNDIDIEDIV